MNGYARTTEIEFLDENRILTYIINSQVQDMHDDQFSRPSNKILRYHMMKWSYRYHHKEKSLEFYEITGNQSFTIPDVKDSGDVIDVSGDYVLFGNLEEKKQAVYSSNSQIIRGRR